MTLKEKLLILTEEKRQKRHKYVYTYLQELTIDYIAESNAFLKAKHTNLSSKEKNDLKKSICLKQIEKDINELIIILNDLR